MATNPIQKKVRNAALIGSLVTLLIMGAIVALLLMQLNKMSKEQKEIEASFVTVCTLGQNVTSGQIITEDMIQTSEAQVDHIPSGATSDISVFTTYSLVDSEGNKVYTDEEGTFLLKDCDYMEVFQDSSNNKYYTYSANGERQDLTGVNERELYSDDDGMYLIRNTESKTRLYQEGTGEYYILRVRYNTNAQGTPVREKESITILGTPLIAKIDMNKNTVLTNSMLSQGKLVTADVRKQEYNAVVLPTDLATGDYIDIRLQLPSGQDFIVVSKKQVEIPIVEGMDSETTIWVNLSEDETLYMSCAIVEAYRINGSRLYATKYTDPGMQEAATPTYPVSAETVSLIQADPNVTSEAQQGLRARYTETLINIRNNNINSELQKPENAETNVQSKMNESIVLTQQERKKYLQSLVGEY